MPAWTVFTNPKIWTSLILPISPSFSLSFSFSVCLSVCLSLSLSLSFPLSVTLSISILISSPCLLSFYSHPLHPGLSSLFHPSTIPRSPLPPSFPYPLLLCLDAIQSPISSSLSHSPHSYFPFRLNPSPCPSLPIPSPPTSSTRDLLKSLVIDKTF